jgi:glutaminyl-tRNA synthetase
LQSEIERNKDLNIAQEHRKNMNFIEEIVEKEGSDRVVTRFPPEPNGYLHLGHAKSIVLNFLLAKKFGGKTNLRFDDTNPETESEEFVNSIREDLKWLGFEPDEEHFASDYFYHLYQYALHLISKGLAYVDDSTSEEIAEMKGTPTEPGKDSPYRNRNVEENLALFTSMAAGEFAEGSKTLRAKIDMASPNMHMRDPILYRIKYAPHHRTEDLWKIYPSYDFAHGQSDSIEGITHSICTLEFAPHRELYDWLIEKLEIFPSKQYEFARLNVTHTVLSKRKLNELVEKGLVTGWDDPRMPTIAGMRRRGYPAAAIREFCDRVGVAKRDNLIEIELLEHCVREELNRTAVRRMVVLDPLRVILTNYAGNEVLEGEDGRKIPFSSELVIEREDFSLTPPPKWHRLAVGQMVRLKNAYIIKCESVETDENGKVIALYCSVIHESRSGNDTSGLKVKGTIHWVSEKDSIAIVVEKYGRLFDIPDVGDDFLDHVTPKEISSMAIAEPAILDLKEGETCQFMRKGYYCFHLAEGRKFNIGTFIETVSLKEGFKIS